MGIVLKRVELKSHPNTVDEKAVNKYIKCNGLTLKLIYYFLQGKLIN